MTARFPILQAATRSGSQRIAAAVAIAFVGALSIPAGSYAQTAATGAASAASAASTPAGVNAGGAQFTVQPGQSLNDAAIAMTQSHDRTVLARAAKAIFDANPNAFMGHDPSRLRLGAILNLPSVDTTGAPVGGAAAASASAASDSAAQTAGGNGASAATSSAAPAAGVSAAAGAGASSAAATTMATATATPATQGASAPATAEATSSTPAAGAQPASGAAAPSASAASGTHSYTGSIQGSEPAATSPSALAANNGQPASQARPSSLQQLLALKNRVLMELQKHGIGKQPGPNENGAPATAATQPSNATPGASAPAHAAPSAAPSTSQPAGIPQEYLAAAGIAGAALVALLAGLTMRRRRKAARVQEEASAEITREDETPPVAPAAAEPFAVAPRDEAPSAAQTQSEPESHGVSAPAVAAAAYEAAASPTGPEHETEINPKPETFHTASAEAALDAASTLGADALPRESLDPAREEARAAEAAELEQAARERELTHNEAVAAPSAELSLDETPIHEPVEPHFVEPIGAPHEEPGAKSKPFVLDLGPAAGSAQLEPTFEQPIAPAAPPIQLSHVEPAAQHEQLIEPLPDTVGETHADTEDEGEATAPSSLPLGAPPPLEPAVPDEFPREAMRALDSIDDFALPPRTEPFASAAPVVTTLGSLATQPVVAPEITAQQAVPSHAPQAPAAADEIIAGTAGAAAVAGLGASRFGALKLDFDLELPPSPAQAVPSFTPAEIARIARNKLDLAAEYIDLGDVVGARTLINEVIESNDADSRADARALLSTLAPLS